MNLSVLEFSKKLSSKLLFWKIYLKLLKKAEIFGLESGEAMVRSYFFLTDMLANYLILKLSI